VSAVKQFPLDERVVYEIPISADAPTTLMFPSALTAIEGANVAANPETPAPVLLAYTPGRTFFSVRALEPNARAAVNVVWKNKTYVLRFAVAPVDSADRAITVMRAILPELIVAPEADLPRLRDAAPVTRDGLPVPIIPFVPERPDQDQLIEAILAALRSAE